jgi:hypothetical protein
MDKDKLTPKEEALLAEARREAAARKQAPTPAPAAPRPQPQAAPRPEPTAAERLAQLMEDERAETQKRKEKMRRRGLMISGGIAAVFALWLLSALRKRR